MGDYYFHSFQFQYIENLTAIKEINFSGNGASGWLQPNLYNFKNLTKLDVSFNRFGGWFPAYIDTLPRLQEINLRNNNFTGFLFSSLGQLTNLTFLDLSNNRFYGELPSTIGNLKSLQTLRLSNNSFSNAIPSSLGGIASLREVDLSGNAFSGTIPASLGSTRTWKKLWLNRNNLTGPIPYELSTITDLTEDINLDDNPSLVCSARLIAEPQPDCPAIIPNYLSLGGTSRIPADAAMKCCGWNRIECSGFEREACWTGDSIATRQTLRVTGIDWSSQNLRGSISPEISNLRELRSLILRDNHITGIMPNTIVQMTQLEQIDLGNNRLSGPLPDGIGNLKNLTRISVSNNLFSEAIPSSVGNLTSLLSLELANNQFTGRIPSTISGLSSLRNLELDDNMLTGEIPSGLGSLTSLLTLSISGNVLSGTIPSALGDLRNLTYLSLARNMLTGRIPLELGNLTKLEFFYLQENRLNGTIPSQLGQLVRLRHLFTSNNFLTGVVPPQIGNLTLLLALRLEANNLTGVPSSLSSLPRAKRVFLPNPMSLVPYDLVSSNPSFTLRATDWQNYLGVSGLRKRQFVSSVGELSAEQLYAMCPLNDVRNPEVPAGCIAGIYKYFCADVSTEASLARCHLAYDQVFTVSIFKPLGDVCFAWKKGPTSFECVSAIKEFRYTLPYMEVTSAHAGYLVSNILASRTFAPCYDTGSITCKW
jgi:Leucine-rich repeat (LRR) protein